MFLKRVETKTERVEESRNLTDMLVFCLNGVHLFNAFELVGRQRLSSSTIGRETLIEAVSAIRSTQQLQPGGIVLTSTAQRHGEIASQLTVNDDCRCRNHCLS